MSYSFKFVAKRDIKGDGKVIMAKGMSIEHVEPFSTSPVSSHVDETLKQHFRVSKVEYGGVHFSYAFEVVRLK